MIKLVNVCGIEFKGWIIENDVQLFRELEKEGFELEIKLTDDPDVYGTVQIANLPCPLIKGYILARSLDGDIDYFINPDLEGKEFEYVDQA